MNLDRYEKIDGWQALHELRDGKKVAREEDGSFVTYEVVADLIFKTEPNEVEMDISDIVLNDLIESNWYIKKPFDVRQAMLDSPNEWVGAVEDLEGNWCKIGFDKEYFVAVEAPIEFDGVPKYFATDCARSTKAALDACIPIEDAPKEA